MFFPFSDDPNAPDYRKKHGNILYHLSTNPPWSTIGDNGPDYMERFSFTKLEILLPNPPPDRTAYPSPQSDDPYLLDNFALKLQELILAKCREKVQDELFVNKNNSKKYKSWDIQINNIIGAFTTRSFISTFLSRDKKKRNIEKDLAYETARKREDFKFIITGLEIAVKNVPHSEDYPRFDLECIIKRSSLASFKTPFK